ncbi:MAG TPA: hypothetical protein VF175_06330 [Lacipirellula sp.]
MYQDCVVGVFESVSDARDAVDQLEQEGWGAAHVSLITRANESELDATSPLDQGDRMEKSAALGAAAGSAIGLLASSALFIIPGIGPVVFAGAIASGITGGLVGGIVGAMSGWGVKEDRIHEYERDLQAGRTLIFVSGDPLRLAEAKSVLDESAAQRVAIHAESADSTVDR